MKKLIFIFVILLGCQASNDKPDNDPDIIINRLLKINNPEYSANGSNGNVGFDELGEQKQWANLYIKYKDLIMQSQKANYQDIKYWLLIGHVSYTENGAEISEAFSSDLLPAFKKYPDDIINILNDLPFLIPSTAFFMNNYFGFEDKNLEKKDIFLNNIRSMILEKLDENRAIEFFECFK